MVVTRANLDPFERDQTVDRLRGIPGLYDISDSTMGDRLSACYDFKGDSTIIRFSDDSQRITVFGTGPASRELIVLVAQVLKNERLRVFDIDYGIDVEIGEMTTSEELRLLLEDSTAS